MEKKGLKPKTPDQVRKDRINALKRKIEKLKEVGDKLGPAGIQAQIKECQKGIKILSGKLPPGSN